MAKTPRSHISDRTSLKPITKHFRQRPIPNSSVDRVRRGIPQISVENATMPLITQLFRKRMNTCRRVTMLPFFLWRVDARQTYNTQPRLSSDGHRDHFFVSTPHPQLSGCQTSVHAQFNIVGRLTDFDLESATPENHQAAVLRTRLSQLSIDVRNFPDLSQFIEAMSLKGYGRRFGAFTPLA